MPQPERAQAEQAQACCFSYCLCARSADVPHTPRPALSPLAPRRRNDAAAKILDAKRGGGKGEAKAELKAELKPAAAAGGSSWVVRTGVAIAAVGAGVTIAAAAAKVAAVRRAS